MLEADTRHRALYQHQLFFLLNAFVLAASLVLGGGTRAGFLGDAILQFLAIPLLGAACWKVSEMPLSKEARLAVFFCLAIFLLPLLQLIPLPPALWTALPNRQTVAEAFVLTGQDLPWMPISVSPQATWLSALALLPPLSIFLATLLLAYRERRLLSLVVLAVGMVSVFIGLIQVAQGPSSSLRFFEFTNPTEAVGFFANRNHFAALLYSLTLFAAAWAAATALHVRSPIEAKSYGTAPIIELVACFTVLVALVAAQAMARSRAGLGLTIVALFGAFALAFWDRRRASGVTPTKLLLGATALAVTFATQFALYRIMERFTFDPLEDARIPFARNTIEAAKAYMPFGSGVGTFIPVYGLFEKPEDTLINTYANHAHNDVLEIWLEAGLPGLILVGLFIIWLVLRSWGAWRSAPAHAPRQVDVYLARAATIVAALLVVHSIVDYPLRTAGIMAIMAFACALLIDPLAPPDGREPAREVDIAISSRNRSAGQLSPGPTSPADARSSGIGTPAGRDRKPLDVDWPKEWRAPSKQGPAGGGKPPGARKPPNA